ncbi:MAG: M20/M25/M40 family metallo-hydrolase [Candidatus Dormiibacterota bacterium]
MASIPSDWQEQVRDLTLRLVAIPSVTGSADEVRFPEQLRTMLLELPYFAAHPDHVRLLPVPGDARGRRNLAALAGNGRPTVLLTGHYDVVTTAGYGPLRPLACDPVALLPALLDTLRREAAAGQADVLAERDLASGDWMCGRGSLDMKCGLACAIAVLARWTAGAHPGSLLFVATPDEEATSAGMRAAIPQIRELAQAWDLEPIAAINLDVTDDRGDGEEGRAVFLGSVGKLLPFVHLVGRETHAGAPPLGLNAALLAAEVTRRVELNPDLVDVRDGEAAPAPVTLHQTDGRQGYDVTTPQTAWCYYNLLRHGGVASAVLERFRGLVGEAVEAAAAITYERALRQTERTGQAPPPRWQPRVLTFAELRALAGDDAPACDRAGDEAPDLPELARRVTEAMWQASRLQGPAAVVGCAGIPYAPVFVGERTERERRLRAAVQRQTRVVGELTGAPIRLRRYFPGISDMSFFGGGEEAVGLQAIAENTPGWDRAIRVDTEAARRLDVPIVNIGPWGRDYHQRLERVFAPYGFGVVPELVWRVVRDLLD